MGELFFLSLKKLNIKKLHPGFFAIWQIKMHLKVKMKWQLGKVFQSILAYLECRFSGIWKEALRLWYQKTYFVSKEPIDIYIRLTEFWVKCSDQPHLATGAVVCTNLKNPTHILGHTPNKKVPRPLEITEFQ